MDRLVSMDDAHLYNQSLLRAYEEGETISQHACSYVWFSCDIIPVGIGGQMPLPHPLQIGRNLTSLSMYIQGFQLLQ